MDLSYDQVHIQLLRHPEKPKRVSLAATFTVKQEKRGKADPRDRLLGARKPWYVNFISLCMWMLTFEFVVLVLLSFLSPAICPTILGFH